MTPVLIPLDTNGYGPILLGLAQVKFLRRDARGKIIIVFQDNTELVTETTFEDMRRYFE